MPMTEAKWIDVDGIRTRYFEKGSGPPLVLILGGNFGSPASASSAIVWDQNFDALSEDFHAVAFDKLGQGHTDNPKNDDYTMNSAVQHANGFIRALGLSDVHLAGHSRGGYLVCRLTLEQPNLIASCTIIDSNTCAPGRGLNDVVLAGAPRPHLSRECQKWIYEHYAYSPHHITDAFLDAAMDVAALPKYQESVRKMEGDGLNTKLFLPGLAKDKSEMFAWIRDKGMQKPTQIIWGQNDPTATIEQGYSLFDLIASTERRTQLQIINRAGHHSFREQPRIFNEMLRGFIQAL